MAHPYHLAVFRCSLLSLTCLDKEQMNKAVNNTMKHEEGLELGKGLNLQYSIREGNKKYNACTQFL